MKKILLVTSVLFCLTPYILAQKNTSLRQQLEKISSARKTELGLSVLCIEDGDTISIHGNKHCVMQSVYKFHLALYILNKVDKGELSLQQKISFKPADYQGYYWSPIKEKFPDGAELTLREALQYTVSNSDNVGCDVLFRLVGGTKPVHDYFKEKKIEDISIQATEAEMHNSWDVQYTNWTTPLAAGNLLKLFYEGKLLSKEQNEVLWKMMVETQTGPKRIKGQLPAGTVVAHKTGTSDTNKAGVMAAVNDIGIVVLPNGKHLIISVFVVESREVEEVNEKLIADLSRKIFDHYANRGK